MHTKLLGDCFSLMLGHERPALVLSDPPYGITQQVWDQPVDWERPSRSRSTHRYLTDRGRLWQTFSMPSVLPSCLSCEHCQPNHSEGAGYVCRRHPPSFVTNTGLSPDRAAYPVLPDTRGCGEHKPCTAERETK